MDARQQPQGDSPLAVWSRHSKHVFVLTAAGKPVWSRWGDEEAQSALAPVVQAVLARTEEQRDPISSFTVGDTAVVVASRGPLHLVAVSRTGEPLHSLHAPCWRAARHSWPA